MVKFRSELEWRSDSDFVPWLEVRDNFELNLKSATISKFFDKSPTKPFSNVTKSPIFLTEICSGHQTMFSPPNSSHTFNKDAFSSATSFVDTRANRRLPREKGESSGIVSENVSVTHFPVNF